MNTKYEALSLKFMAGASVLALGCVATPAFAQDPVQAEDSVAAEDAEGDVIIVTGIRASLRNSLNTKRNGEGILDAISAEDIGKFPDTNLAESLQRITGVSIDRTAGEGSTVTVRGFGADYNLVLLNGRQMPTSTLGDSLSPPASRSFDFGALASEAVAGIEVYKSGNVKLPTGGIGSTINIKTPRPLDRPGFQGSIGVKGVIDNTFEGTKVTPEVSGILSKTFADDTFGIAVTGSYQKRKADLAEYQASWLPGNLGSVKQSRDIFNPSIPGVQETYTLPAAGQPNYDNIKNRPGAEDIYQVPQEAAYRFANINRERINAQLVLQWAPSDQFEARADYTFSQNTFDATKNRIGAWNEFGWVGSPNGSVPSSSWTDGPVAGPNIYSEQFNVPANVNGAGLYIAKDLSFQGSTESSRTRNQSLGINLKWTPEDSGFRWSLDAHHSTAVSKPNSPYGSSNAVGAAVFGVKQQTTDYTTYLPVLSVTQGDNPLAAYEISNIRSTGTAFRNAYMKDRIDEVALKGGYDFDEGFLSSLDFGVNYTDNKVNTSFGSIQSDDWRGFTNTADKTPDQFFSFRSLPDDLAGIEGADSPNIIQKYVVIDTKPYIDWLEENQSVCSNAWNQVKPIEQGTCLAEYTTNSTIREKTIAAYAQASFSFDLFDREANLRQGLRYENTIVTNSALTPIPENTIWVSDNELAFTSLDGSDFRTVKGNYSHWLPSMNFDFRPAEDVVVRASYSETITRPQYNYLNGAVSINIPPRPYGASTGNVGNPGLLPYKSQNIDLSGEWYYGPESYFSVGYFRKKVKNFIANDFSTRPALGLPDPAQGVAANAARAALGNPNASFQQIKDWLKANQPGVIDARTGGIIGQPGDASLQVKFNTPQNSDRVGKINGWEFAWQHSLWDTGFGFILNYTIVNSDVAYDNTRPYYDTLDQFAIVGVSDSANAVAYYDKNGFQARLAYNWRDKFLSGYGSDPFYTEAYGQLDGSISYEFENGVSIFGEAINLTKSDRRIHMRNEQNAFFAAPGYTRWSFGARYSF